MLVEQEPEQSLGGQAFWSLGGLFLVNTPLQRRMGIRDSYALAMQDWMGTASFDRKEDEWPRKWAEAYIGWAAGEKYSWLRGLGIRFFPIVGWAERGGGAAAGRGNSVPRFHVTWGTGPGVLEPFVAGVRAAMKNGLATLRFRHQVDELIVTGRSVTGVRGSLLEPSEIRRGEKSSRRTVGEFSYYAQAVIVASGGIGANLELVRSNWPKRLGQPPSSSTVRRAGACRWPDAGDHAAGRGQRYQLRPDVALYGRSDELGPDLEGSWDSHTSGTLIALVRRNGKAAACSIVPGIRHNGDSGVSSPYRS